MCPQPVDSTSRIPTEPFTPDQFDENYYTAVLRNQGILTSDSSLLVNVKTGRYVTEYAGNRAVFFQRFAAAMLKMGRVGVKLGIDGEVRRVCSAVNWTKIQIKTKSHISILKVEPYSQNVNSQMIK